MDALFKKVQCLISDVDGVLTNGDIIFSETGQESRTFNTQDGFGIQLLMKQGIQFGIITSHQSGSILARMKQLGVEHVYQGYSNKLLAFQALLSELAIPPEEVAYVGDDWLDLPIFKHVGLSIAVANAVDEVKQAASWVTSVPGGSGAIREIAMRILKAKKLDQTLLSAVLI